MALSFQDRQNLFFSICDSKEVLQQHLKSFLKVDLPDYSVDEESTTNAMNFIWEIYNTMRTNEGPKRHVVAASRNSGKTLSACILRFYAMIHFRRSGTHLAATLDQSASAISYFDKFLRVPELEGFLDTSNTRNKVLKNLPPNSFTNVSECTLRVAVATKSGVNSQRGSLNMRDETDLIPPEIIAEASFIADVTQDDYHFDPIEINLSSRKLDDGPMESLIQESGTNPESVKLHKWSMVDWMKECPAETHKADKPVKAWINTDNLKVTWKKTEYAKLSSNEKNLQKEINCFEGCKTCTAFIACQGRAPKQKSISKMLRNISFIGQVLSSVKDPDMIISQALNWRPGKSATVFKMFKRPIHFKKPYDAYKWITGKYWNPTGIPEAEIEARLADGDTEVAWLINPSKMDIYNAMIEHKWQINYGVDWAYAPATATCIVVGYQKRQQRAFILHVETSQHLANQQWADYIVKNIWSVYPGDLICPDMADPASPSYFAKHKIMSRNKKPAKIDTGVSQLRSLMWDPVSQTEKFAVLDDGTPESEAMTVSLEKWTHRKTPLGFNFDKYEDNDYCDYCDPTRYALDPFIRDLKITASSTQGMPDVDVEIQAAVGNPEAQKILEQKKEFSNQFQTYMSDEFGLHNIFDKGTDIVTHALDPNNNPLAPKPEEPNKRPTGGGGIRFKF